LPVLSNNQQVPVFKCNPQVVFTELDGQTALFQAETCEYLILNDTGSAIWGLIDSPRSLQEICNQLAEDYEIDLDTCILETEAWLNTAVDKKVVFRTAD